ncbi:MAG: ABC transporter ATP-binding protein [Eubacterium sp.]|nr:ABC transporter ATP-binding protein [Eubacterium sp.]
MDDMALIIKEIKKCYKNQYVLKGINMSFEKGKIYGIIGPNGVGKTTLIRIIAGLSNAESGKIIYEGKEKTDNRKIGYIIESPYLIESLNAKDNMRLYAMLNGINDNSRIDDLLSWIGLKDANNKLVKDYSLGMKQRLGIACTLIKNPDIIFLDEPMNGMDPEGVFTLRSQLLQLAHDDNKTIVVTSHILSEMSKLCDKYYFIKDGLVIKEIDDNVDNLEELYMELIVGK